MRLMACPPRIRPFPADDAAVQVHVDVAARQQDDGFAFELDFPGQDRRDADRAGAFDDLALDRVGMPDARGDLGFGQQDDIVEQVSAHAEGVVGSTGRCRRRANPPASATPVTGTGLPASRLAFMAAPRCIETPMTLVEGEMPLTAAAMPAASPPPESCTSTVLAAGVASIISRPERALPGDHGGMIEGRHHGQLLVADQPIDFILGVVLAVADDAYVGAEPANFGELVFRHQPRHADHRTHTLKLRRMRQRAAMIAGGCGDHAARLLGG